ncbi:MAG: hypothetical protein ACI8W3_000194 [Myxococcota bacterium]
MPISYVVDTCQKLVEVTVEGDLTDEELIQHCETMRADPSIDPDFVELDHLDSTLELISINAIRAVAEMLEDSTLVRKMAIYTQRDVAFGLARMYEMLGGESATQVAVFRNLSEAKAWLEAP